MYTYRPTGCAYRTKNHTSSTLRKLSLLNLSNLFLIGSVSRACIFDRHSTSRKRMLYRFTLFMNGCFFYRVTLFYVRLSVCPAVCPAATFVCCIQTAEDIVELLSRARLGSPIILVFLIPSADTQLQGELLQRGRQIHRGWGKICGFRLNAVYLRNGKR